MSILSTNQKLIKVGQYYSAGDNIGINDYVISSRNWTPDITYASESAYSRSTAYTNDWIAGQYANDLTATNERITNLSGEFVPQSAFNELKQSYDALSSLFATYSGQWLLPNE